MTQTPKEYLFTELFHRRPVEDTLVREAFGAFQKEVVALAFYWLGLGNRSAYTAIMTEVLKGSYAKDVVAQVPIYGTWGDVWELYGISDTVDKAIDSVVFGQFSEDQESEKPSQFVKCLPVDLKNPLSKHFAGLLFPLTQAGQRMRRYRKAVSCLKRFTSPAEPERRIFLEDRSAVADKLLDFVNIIIMKRDDTQCIMDVGLSDNLVFMCDYSDSMCGKPMDISLALGIMKGRIMSFDKQPRWHIFTGEDTLQKKILSTHYISKSSQADFNIAYELILKGVIYGKITVPKFFIVITDMDYKDSCACVFNVKGVREAFSKEGYEAPMLIIWNVSTAFRGPYAVLYEEGVAEMRGWSDSMLNMLKGHIRVITPIELVRAYHLNIIL